MQYNSDHTDETLAEKAQAGDKQAEETLIQRYSGVNLAIAKAFPIRGLDIEDVEMFGIMAAIGAVRSYRADGGSIFATYVRRCIANKLRDEYRKATKQAQIPARLLCNLSDAAGLEDDDEASLADAIPSPLDVEAMVCDEIDNEAMLKEMLSRTWPYFSAVIRNRVQNPCAITDIVLDAIRAVAQSKLNSHSYGDLRALILEDVGQPCLFGGRGSQDAEDLATEVLLVFGVVRNHVLRDLVEGYTYAEIAERQNLSEDAVGRVIKATRAVATGVIEEAA